MDDMSQRDSRLEELEKVDKDIIQLLTLAGNCLQELSKEKPVLKTAELHSSQFLKTLENIDRVLIQQVSHLQQISTGVSHEGSHYDCTKERELFIRLRCDVEKHLDYLAARKDLYLSESAQDTNGNGERDEVQVLQDGSSQNVPHRI